MLNPETDARPAPTAGAREFKRLRATLAVTALCVAGLALAVLATSAGDARRAMLSLAQDKADGLALSLNHHAAHTFHGVQMVLRLAATDHANRLRQGAPIAEMNATLAQLAEEAPLIRSVLILDASGRVVADSRPAPAAPFDASDRAYFQVHRDRPDAGFFISEPVRGKATPEWRVVASRRLEDAQGRFRGVAMAVLSPEEIAKVYGDHNQDGSLRVTLYRDDGTVLVHHPFDPRAIGEKPDDFQAFVSAPGVLGRAATASYSGERRFAYKFLSDLPLAIGVAYDSDEVLAPWRQSLPGYAAWAAGAMAAIVVVVLLMLVMVQQREFSARALIASERRLGDLVASMSDWVWEQDAELRFSYVADHHLKRVGLDARKMLGKRREEIAADPDTEEMRRHRADLEARRPFRDLLVGRRLDDGRLVHFSISGKPLFGDDGRFLGYRGTGRDVTAEIEAKRRAEASAAEVQRSRDLLRAVLNNVPARIHLKDRDRRYVMVNDQQLQIWGVGLDDVLGKRFGEIPLPAMEPEQQTQRAAEIELKERAILATGKAEKFYHDLYAAPGESPRAYLTSKIPLRDDDGAPNAILTVGVDVTDIKRAETQAKTAAEELSRSRDLLQAVLDTVPANISVKDADRRFVLMNKAQLEAWGVPLDSVLGNRLEDIRVPTMSAAAFASFAASGAERDREILASGRARLFHADVLPGADGKPIHWLTSKIPLRGAAGATGAILTVAVDVSAIKNAEMQAQTAAVELKKNRDLLQAVLDNVPARVSVKDRERRYVLVNKFGLESWGVSAEQALGRRREEFLAPNVSEANPRIARIVANRDRQVLGSGEPMLFFEDSWPGADGALTHHLVSKVPLRDDAGSVDSVLTVSMDITPLKQAEERSELAAAELKKNRDLLQAVLDAVPALINVKDSERRYILVNKAHLDDYRLPLDAMLGKRLEEIAVPTIKPEEFPAFAAHVAERDQALLAGAEAQVFFEESFTDPDSKRGYWLTSKIPLPGPDGKPYAIVTAAVDITDRKEAELKIAEANQRLADYVDTSSDWFWETDAAHCFTYLSDGLRRVLGVDPAKLIGRSRMDISADQADDPAKWSAHRAALDQRRPFRDFVYRTELGGAHRYIAASGKPAFDAEGRFVGYRGIGCDVTAEVGLKRALVEAKNAAEVASRAKSEFLANMSHELRTPLNAVIGFSDMLATHMAGPLTAKQAEYLHDIGASGRHLLDVINDVLDLAKIEAGRMDLREEMLDVAGVAADCTRLVRERAGNAGVTMQERIRPALKLYGDVLALKKILTNLLSNAVKFTEAGGSVTLDAVLNGRGECVISVADTGVGMGPEEIEKALEPFGQVDSTLTRRHQGTGLGLPLAVSLTERMGGRLEIDSEPGRGTTVRVVLPAERVLHSAA